MLQIGNKAKSWAMLILDPIATLTTASQSKSTTPKK
jgi:hypothetical protein